MHNKYLAAWELAMTQQDETAQMQIQVLTISCGPALSLRAR